MYDTAKLELIPALTVAATEAGVSAVACAIDAMTTMAGFWANSFSAHAEVVGQSIRTAAEKQEAASWYRHPDGIYAAGPDSIKTGWPWVGMGMHALPEIAAMWAPFMRPDAFRWASSGMPLEMSRQAAGLAAPFAPFMPPFAAFVPSVPMMPAAMPVEPMAAATDLMMSSFSSYRSEGGHALAQIIFEAANDTAQNFGQNFGNSFSKDFASTAEMFNSPAARAVWPWADLWRKAY